MTPVMGSSDLAIGDVVEVQKHEYRGLPPAPRRGSVVRVGKVSAIIAFAKSQETIRYAKIVTAQRGGLFRGTYKRKFHPISKLSARDIWRSEVPGNGRVWTGGPDAPTLIVSRSAARDEIDLVIEDLRKYSEWLQREPKEGS